METINDITALEKKPAERGGGILLFYLPKHWTFTTNIKSQSPLHKTNHGHCLLFPHLHLGAVDQHIHAIV